MVLVHLYSDNPNPLFDSDIRVLYCSWVPLVQEFRIRGCKEGDKVSHLLDRFKSGRTALHGFDLSL